MIPNRIEKEFPLGPQEWGPQGSLRASLAKALKNPLACRRAFIVLHPETLSLFLFRTPLYENLFRLVKPQEGLRLHKFNVASGYQEVASVTGIMLLWIRFAWRHPE